jgi:ribonucleoside-diphosphate reductase alpha chain
MTTYRYNPDVVSGVLVQKHELENTKYLFKLEDGSSIEAMGTDVIEYDGEEHIAANLYDALSEGLYGNM